MPMARHKNGQSIIKRARSLRQSGSMVERLLWRELRLSPEQQDIKFRYQHPLSHYVVDFVCLPAKLVVEIDGPSHDVDPNKDKVRQQAIEALGYRVIRFSNDDVVDNVWAVAETIRITAKKLLTQRRSHNPSPKSQAISTLPQGEGDPCLSHQLEHTP